MVELTESHSPTLCKMQLYILHDSFVLTTVVTIMTNLPLIVLELYKNIAKCTLHCVIMDQIDAIVFKLFCNLFLRRNKQS